jgi:hypothetical protein
MLKEDKYRDRCSNKEHQSLYNYIYTKVILESTQYLKSLKDSANRIYQVCLDDIDI